MLALLDGTWRLAYTSNSELLAILALSRLPLLSVGDITQRIDSASSTVENRAALSGPLSSTALSATASFEVRSPKRLSVRFERGGIATPQLMEQLDLPESLPMLGGGTVDLAPLRGLLQPVRDGVSGALGVLDGLLRDTPDLSFPLPGSDATSTWLLTTYLDADTRISRGDGGSVFILVKQPEPRSSTLDEASAEQQAAAAETVML
jgi:hypothetical protein